MCWRIGYTGESVELNNETFTMATIGLISMLELWLSIICACMPSLGPLMKLYVSPACAKLMSKVYVSRGSRMWLWFTPSNSGRRHGKERHGNKEYDGGFECLGKHRGTTDTELLQVTIDESDV